MEAIKNINQRLKLVIDKITNNDEVLFHYLDSNVKSKQTKAKLRTYKQEPYFMTRGKRHYLRDFTNTA